MGLLISSLQLLERRMRIDLRRSHTCVTQQFLYILQSRTVIQHSRSKRMWQHVGRAFLLRRYQRKALVDDAFYLRSRHPLAFVIPDQGFTVGYRRLLVTLCHIGDQRLLQLFAKGNDALFVPLAGHLQLMGGEVNILIVQGCHFCQSHSRLIE